MAITMMCRAEDEGAVFSDYWSNRDGSNPKHMPIYLRTTHTGLVLYTGEYNGREDSDFYALVWDDEHGKPHRIEYASTRGWSYPNTAEVDATPDVVAKYDAYKQRVREEDRAARERCVAATPDKGKRVRVIAGRKVAVGTEGVVFWYGKDRFDRSGRYTTPLQAELRGYFAARDANGQKSGYRVGLMLDDGSKVFIAATNVEVIELLGEVAA